FTEALKTMPGDREATTQRDAAQRLQLADEKHLAEEKHNAEHARLMSAGLAAMKGKQYQDAVNAFSAALKVKPTDAATQRSLDEAQKALEAPKRPAPPPPPDPKARIKAEYNKDMNAGLAALKAKNYAGAANAFTEALKQMPGDPTATAQRDQA